ncbi:exodeoxyribonuclease III [Leptospira sp. 96542]|nr:exodeoxyribonuclease III [Leptospira sp. 96542]
MKVISLNCNGIRSSISKGLFDYIRHENPDIICFQETKAPESEIRHEEWNRLGFRYIYTCLAEKPGYSGTAVVSKQEAKSFESGFGGGIFKSEGRSIFLEFSNFTLWNLYFPSGTSGDERQKIKYKFLDAFLKLVVPFAKKKKPLIICGDVNIAHTEKDIHNPKGNIKNSGFLPEERAWMDKFLSQGFADCFRTFYPDLKDVYSWWTYRFQARKNNKGWRIDYFFIQTKQIDKIEEMYISNEPVLSDHAPVVLSLQIT